MKKFFLLQLVIIAISAGTTQAQSSLIKVNVLSPVVRTGSVFYEHAIADDKSLQLGVFYTNFKADDTRFSGYGITPEFRKYLSKSKQAPAGFYLAPFLRYQSFKIKADMSEGGTSMEAKGSLNTFGGGLTIGNQWIFGEHFVVDAFFGPSYNAGKVKVESGDEDSIDAGSFSGFGIRTGLAFGLKF
ncbi:DUF3575 domain-containing protein [Pontibacter locisalis]|uniref:DUF3575 domain-containing protein n=1 Tax=Pontibacter locisalis TaxID=1719035 RepID=A0ABW5IMJ0_9BACT